MWSVFNFNLFITLAAHDPWIRCLIIRNTSGDQTARVSRNQWGREGCRELIVDLETLSEMAVERKVEAEGAERKRSWVIIMAEHCMKQQTSPLQGQDNKIDRAASYHNSLLVLFEACVSCPLALWLMRLFCSFSASPALLQHKTSFAATRRCICSLQPRGN